MVKSFNTVLHNILHISSLVQMAVRITNGVLLGRVLPWLHEHIVSSVQNPNLLVSSYQGSGCVKSETYCQYGPCPDGSTAGLSGGGV